MDNRLEGGAPRRCGLGPCWPTWPASYDVLIRNAVGCVIQPPVVLYVYEAVA